MPSDRTPTLLHRKPRAPQPANSFMLYRRVMVKSPPILALARESGAHISRVVADLWREEPLEVREEYRLKGIQAQIEHSIQYPDYKLPKEAGAYIKEVGIDHWQSALGSRSPRFPSHDRLSLKQSMEASRHNAAPTLPVIVLRLPPGELDLQSTKVEPPVLMDAPSLHNPLSSTKNYSGVLDGFKSVRPQLFSTRRSHSFNFVCRAMKI